MEFTRPTAEIFVPDGIPPDQALARTTHLAIGAHPDDLEIMALEGVLAGFGSKDLWFAGVTVTDGAGSARDGIYARYTDEEMRAVRRQEQKKAAVVGEYAAQVLLDHPSSTVKDPGNREPVRDLQTILRVARPQVVYTHNLADKHPTHVAVALRALAAIRELPADARPRRLVGCEVWRDLDWMVDSDKVIFRLDAHENIAVSLVGIFDSQIIGGKRYDLATMGRRRANATYLESHAVDTLHLANFGMELTPLIQDDSLDVSEYVSRCIDRFAGAVREMLANLQ